ncbi:MAG TPA: class I SAM-dependent methyltransferase [Ktedonobacteraceae bacterium]|nr:class I SAM-dependent methyltransferase [Ktedonobacteraceae bacterium]
MAVEEIYRYPADYDLEVASRAVNDIPFWLDLLRREHPAHVLEIGSGTGRLTVPLAREGVASNFLVTGLDVESAMLARAQERLSIEPADVRDTVRLIQADICSFTCKERFDVILMPYGVAHHLTDLAAQIAAWENVHTHLVRGGLFVVDLVAPDFQLLAQALHGVPRATDLDVRANDGRHLQRSAAVSYASACQTVTYDYLYDVVDADGTRRHYQSPFTMHVYYPHELELLFRLTGFRYEPFIGSYTGKPFTNASHLMIALARS